jgi:phospholipid transport system substrate-binding protein
MKRWNGLFLCLLSMMTLNVLAAEKPLDMLQNVLHNVLTLDKQVMADNRDAIFKKLETEVLPYFSFDYMTEWTASSFEHELSATQSAQLTRQLQGLFLTRLLQALNNDESDYTFNMLAPTPNLRARELAVTVQVQQQQKIVSALHFRLYRNQDGWKIFDLVVNQESMMHYLRTYFQQRVQQDGVTALFGK